VKRTRKRYKRLRKRLDWLFRALEFYLGDRRHRQAKTRLREMWKLHIILSHPGWYRRSS